MKTSKILGGLLVLWGMLCFSVQKSQAQGFNRQVESTRMYLSYVEEVKKLVGYAEKANEELDEYKKIRPNGPTSRAIIVDGLLELAQKSYTDKLRNLALYYKKLEVSELSKEQHEEVVFNGEFFSIRKALNKRQIEISALSGTLLELKEIERNLTEASQVLKQYIPRLSRVTDDFLKYAQYTYGTPYHSTFTSHYSHLKFTILPLYGQIRDSIKKLLSTLNQRQVQTQRYLDASIAYLQSQLLKEERALQKKYKEIEKQVEEMNERSKKLNQEGRQLDQLKTKNEELKKEIDGVAARRQYLQTSLNDYYAAKGRAESAYHKAMRELRYKWNYDKCPEENTWPNCTSEEHAKYREAYLEHWRMERDIAQSDVRYYEARIRQVDAELWEMKNTLAEKKLKYSRTQQEIEGKERELDKKRDQLLDEFKELFHSPYSLDQIESLLNQNQVANSLMTRYSFLL